MERKGEGRQGDALWRPSSSVNTLRVTLLSGVMVGFISWNKFLAIGLLDTLHSSNTKKLSPKFLAPFVRVGRVFRGERFDHFDVMEN